MSEKINIAIIAGQLVVGGAERQLYLWLSNLDRSRFNPVVLTLHPGYGDYWEAPIEALGIPLYRIQRKKNRLSRLVDIIKILRRHHPELIHGWHTFAGAYAGVSGKLIGAKSLGGIRGSHQAIENTWEGRLTRFFCDAVLANSAPTASDYQAKMARKGQQVFTVPNAVQPHFEDRSTARSHLSQAYGLPADGIWVATMGRMDPLKRFDLILNLAATFKVDDAKVHFILVGDGPEKETLVGLTRRMNLEDRVTFTGEVPNASRWMKGFDVFCFPSVDEGLPNVVMEAAAASLPIVAWGLPFNEALLTDEDSALLVQPGDMNGFTDALTRLVDSAPLRARLGSSAQGHILANFSLANYIQRMTAVYEAVLGI